MPKPGDPYRPCNGSEGERFESAFCERCERDRPYRLYWKDEDDPEADSTGCEIHTNALAFERTDPAYPKEWTFDANGRPVCTAFEPELPRDDEGRRLLTAAGDPEPARYFSTDPAQTSLF